MQVTFFLIMSGSTKAVNKPKTKNINQSQHSDLNKSKSTTKNSTGNIYDSIMGQIDTPQQDYIKSLIVKNQKESLKTQNQSQKELTKFNKDTPHEQKKVILKTPKQLAASLKGSITNLHEKTKSQTDLFSKQAKEQIETERFVKGQGEKRNTEIIYPSCEEAQNNFISSSKVRSVIVCEKQGSTRKQQTSTNFPQTISSSNPIIQAINNTSTSFVKNLQAFQLQYPIQQRQQRSTHKKVHSKLIGQYYSCQASPKNSSKNTYANDTIVTTKQSQAYYNSENKNDKQQSVKNSPFSAGKISTVKINQKKFNEDDQNVPINFLSCLDDYLEALTLNPNESQENSKPSNGPYNMKRNNSNKMKEFSTTKGFPHPFAFDKQDEQEETVVLQNVNYQNVLNNKIGQPKHLSLAQQQMIIKSLEKEKKKVSQLKSIMELFNQQLTKYKKKEKKLKENQYHMIECLKSLNQELTEEKKQRRKLEQVVKDFESKIRGISRGKEKKRRGSMVDDQMVERQTIYGASSMVSNTNYPQTMNGYYYQPDEMMSKQTPHRLERQSKKDSKNRFSSVINNMTQDYSRNLMLNGEEQYDYYPEKREDGFSKNRTQKVTKIISTFDLDDQLNDNEVRYSHVRNSNKNMNPPNTCKNSFLNISLPNKSKNLKSTPITPRIIQELFNGSKKSKKNQPQDQFFNQRIEVNNFETESEEQSLREYRQARHYDEDENMNGSSDEDSSFNPTTINSSRSYSFDERNEREYNGQQSDVLIRMR